MKQMMMWTLLKPDNCTMKVTLLRSTTWARLGAHSMITSKNFEKPPFIHTDFAKQAGGIRDRACPGLGTIRQLRTVRGHVFERLLNHSRCNETIATP
jgi:hypothetical protein